ncbi:MAG: hypothetical protein ACO1TE_23655 [Prosthecobacter sp.]
MTHTTSAAALAARSQKLGDAVADPEMFMADYGACEFPHRDELFEVLRTRRFREFTTDAGLVATGQPQMTCRRYARTYKIRAGSLLRRLESSPELAGLHADFVRLHTTLEATPDEPCQLFLCVTENRTYAVFCRPKFHNVAGCWSAPKA